MRTENMYIANLSFLLDYDIGEQPDEIESEIFKVAFQSKETVHYDRSIGGGFPDLEQEPGNVATSFKFVAGLIESIYIVNQEKDFEPYIIVGFNDINVIDKSSEGGEYLIQIGYKLLSDLSIKGQVKI
jgi:hypothetical protein